MFRLASSPEINFHILCNGAGVRWVMAVVKQTEMRAVFTLLSASLLLAIASCKKDSIAHASDYNASYTAWLQFKDSSHNSYRYKVVSGSWTGTSSETIISVRDGKVVGRSFKYTVRLWNSTTTTTMEEWVENEVQLNTHEKGAGAITLDAVYQQARENWLKKRDDADTYFEARNHGKLSSAGYVPHGCADDCFRGITIALIEAI